MAGREEEQLNTAIGWQLEREARDDEWYVDALAVFSTWGRQGIGTRLLHAALQPHFLATEWRQERRLLSCI